MRLTVPELEYGNLFGPIAASKNSPSNGNYRIDLDSLGAGPSTLMLDAEKYRIDMDEFSEFSEYHAQQ
jgi:hypothetical protein